MTALDGCELATADGQAVVWAARLLGRPLPERVAGIDLMEALLERGASSDGYRVLSARRSPRRCRPGSRGDRGSASRASSVAGSHHGYFDPAEEDAVVAGDRRRAHRTSSSWRWRRRRRSSSSRGTATRLGVPFVMGVGGAFDVFAGERTRAPRVLQRLGTGVALPPAAGSAPAGEALCRRQRELHPARAGRGRPHRG